MLTQDSQSIQPCGFVNMTMQDERLRLKVNGILVKPADILVIAGSGGMLSCELDANMECLFRVSWEPEAIVLTRASGGIIARGLAKGKQKQLEELMLRVLSEGHRQSASTADDSQKNVNPVRESDIAASQDDGVDEKPCEEAEMDEHTMVKQYVNQNDTATIDQAPTKTQLALAGAWPPPPLFRNAAFQQGAWVLEQE